MHLQLMFLALVAPLTLSLPQPIPQGETAALAARQESGNSTGWGNGEHHLEKHPHHPGGFHPERDLVERQESSNSTGSGEEHHGQGRHHGEGDYHHHPERDLSERQESGNSTGGGEEHHGQGNHHFKGDHHWGNVEKRIEEANGTTGGHTDREKYWPDGHRGPHGQHERALVDDVLDKRQGNATGEGKGRHEGWKGHWGPEERE
ncbi:hypothetical protein BDR22DRAFT_888480 [Usnea florida]